MGNLLNLVGVSIATRSIVRDRRPVGHRQTLSGDGT